MTVVLAVQHASSPSSQGRFESGRSLAVLAQLAEAQVLGTWRSGFESPGRYSWKVNQTGALGSVASGCAGETVPFESVAFCSWRMNQLGRLAPAGNRVAGNAVRFEFSVLCHLRPVHTGPGSRGR